MKLTSLIVLLGAFAHALGNYYYLAEGCTPIRMNFLDAYSKCIKQGLMLVTPDTKAKNDELLVFFETHSLSYAYTSANDLIEEGNFEWFTTGESVNNTGVWHKGEPNNYGDQDCVYIGLMGHILAWDDGKCILVTNVVCESASDKAVALAASRVPFLREAFEKRYGVQAPVVDDVRPIIVLS